MPKKPLEFLAKWGFDRGVKVVFLIAIYNEGFALDAYTAGDILREKYGMEAKATFLIVTVRLLKRLGILDKERSGKGFRITERGKGVYASLIAEFEKLLGDLKKH